MRTTEKIEAHFKRNKKTYLACGGTAVIAVVGTLYYSKTRPMVSNTINQGLAYKSPPTIEVWIEALGDPGNVIQDTTTGTIYASQGQAARELGLKAPAISKHLNGLSPHVNGHTFTKLGKASVS